MSARRERIPAPSAVEGDFKNGARVIIQPADEPGREFERRSARLQERLNLREMRFAGPAPERIHRRNVRQFGAIRSSHPARAADFFHPALAPSLSRV